jgi:hypothetical protein
MAGFTPEHAGEQREYFTHLPELFGEMGAALSAQADRLESDHPYAGRTTDALRELAAVVAGLADHATEMHSTFETEFEPELARIDNPRPGEAEFDVSRQD